jgi:hypothetical protein
MDGIGLEILDRLKAHGVRRPRDLLERYQRWGPQRTLDLMIDLSTLDHPPLGRSSSLTIAPVGGCLGLGRAEEYTRRLLLYADRILFFDEIGPIAQEAVRDRESRGWDRARAAGWFTQVYPYLHQLLTARDAVEAGLVVVGPAALLSPEASEPTPILQSLITNAPDDYAEFGILDGGEGWARFGTGEREVSVLGGVRLGGMTLRQGDPPTSTRPNPTTPSRPLGVWRQISAEEFRERFPGEWFALGKLVGSLVERVGQAIELSTSTGAFLLSDQLEDQTLFGTLLGHPLGSYEGAEVDSLELASALDFIERVPLNRLVALRSELQNEFDRFRASFVVLGTTLRSLEGPERTEAAERIVREEIAPALAELELRVRHESSTRLGAAAVFTAAAALSLVTWAVTGQGLATLAEIAALPSLQRAIDDRSGARLDPFFFLYRLRGSSK